MNRLEHCDAALLRRLADWLDANPRPLSRPAMPIPTTVTVELAGHIPLHAVVEPAPVVPRRRLWITHGDAYVAWQENDGKTVTTAHVSSQVVELSAGQAMLVVSDKPISADEVLAAMRDEIRIPEATDAELMEYRAAGHDF